MILKIEDDSCETNQSKAKNTVGYLLFYFFRLYTNTFCKMIIHQNQNELNEIPVNLIVASIVMYIELFQKN